jgi:hypothetical protein
LINELLVGVQKKVDLMRSEIRAVCLSELLDYKLLEGKKAIDVYLERQKEKLCLSNVTVSNMINLWAMKY